jgi:hypothetical protein
MKATNPDQCEQQRERPVERVFGVPFQYAEAARPRTGHAAQRVAYRPMVALPASLPASSTGSTSNSRVAVGATIAWTPARCPVWTAALRRRPREGCPTTTSPPGW